MTTRIAQGVSKFAVSATDDVRVAQGVSKFVVRTFPRIVVLKTYPPFDTTISQAPYVVLRR